VRATLNTERLLLRPAIREDVESLARVSGATTTERIIALVERSMVWWSDHGYGLWVLLDPKTQELVGWCGLRPGSSARDPEVIYGLATSARGSGLATEAVRAVVAFAFGNPDVHSVWAATAPTNYASVAVMERVGMTFDRRGELDGIQSLIYRIQKATANNALERTRDG
jgi:ribosomal-protein-alanine N-acetyltransferase